MFAVIKAHPYKAAAVGLAVFLAGAFVERATAKPMNWTPIVGSLAYSIASATTTATK